jgi:hypothetical protein
MRAACLDLSLPKRSNLCRSNQALPHSKFGILTNLKIRESRYKRQLADLPAILGKQSTFTVYQGR